MHDSTCYLAAAFALATAIAAQPPCTNVYAPGQALAGTDGDVYCMQPWDPDGAGPLPELLVLGGSFRTAGNVACRNVAAYEPQTGRWFAIGSGLPGSVNALAGAANGRLVAAVQSSVYEWNGSGWTQLGGILGTGFYLGVSTVAVLGNGDVIAGGSFQGIGSANIFGLARWDGSAWQTLGAPTAPWALGSVDRLLRMPNGELIVAGIFTQIGGVACSRLARFDGAQWFPIGTGLQYVNQLVSDGSGNLIALGSFMTPTGTAALARWNGSTWIDIGQGLPTTPALVAPLPNGGLLASIASVLWANTTGTWAPFAPWNPTSTPAASISVVHAWSASDVLVGGQFAPTALVPGRNVARWNGSVWSVPNRGNHGPVTAVAALADGSFLVGGNFTQIDGLASNRLARFDGSTWTPIASSATAAPRRMIARPNGDAVVIGTFPNAVTGGLDFVMEWNGSQLQPIQTGLWGTRLVQALGIASNGDALLAFQELFPTQAGFARWNGTTLTLASFPGFVGAIAGLANGDVLLAGSFQFAGSYVGMVRWNGTQLQPFGTPLNGPILAIAVLPNSDVLVGGGFTQPLNIARWDGSAWQPLGAGLPYPVSSLAVLPNGDVVAATFQTPTNVTQSTVHRWNGSSWTLLADTYGRADVVRSPSGTVVLHGEFTQAGGAVQAYFARIAPTCPASVFDRGGGCVGSAGPVRLVVNEPAWLGAVLSTEVRGLPTLALAMSVYGFAAWSLPLSLLHPAGLPGCTLLATGDLLQLLPSSGGAATAQLSIPNSPALVGASFEHQVLGIELDASGNVTAIAGSNALRFTLGML